MKRLAFFCFVTLSSYPSLLATTQTEPKLLVDGISWPESPLLVGSDLYYVAYGSHDVMRWRDGEVSVFWHEDGCGPAAIAAGKDGRFIVSCYDANSLVHLGSKGEKLDDIRIDGKGQGFTGPNDFTLDHKGGYYFTASGVFDPSAPVSGKVYYVNPAGEMRGVAEDIHYANGLALTPDGRTLLVAEHLQARILAFSVDEEGGLADRRVWKNLDELAPAPTAAAPTYGVDGLKIDAEGFVYITNYASGRLLITNANGTLLYTVVVPDPYIDNVAVGDDGKLYISAVRDESASPWPGAIYRVDNPVRAAGL